MDHDEVDEDEDEEEEEYFVQDETNRGNNDRIGFVDNMSDSQIERTLHNRMDANRNIHFTNEPERKKRKVELSKNRKLYGLLYFAACVLNKEN
jgi:hypothetical protein